MKTQDDVLFMVYKLLLRDCDVYRLACYFINDRDQKRIITRIKMDVIAAQIIWDGGF